MSTEPVKRKRGRPCKNKQPEAPVNTTQKKRGRKKRSENQVFDISNFETIETRSKKIETRSIIVHLPIDLTGFVNAMSMDTNSNSNFEFESFDLQDNMNFENNVQNIENTFTQAPEYNLITEEKTFTRKISNILMEFEDLENRQELMTNICCWHCCHNFTNSPIGIPQRYVDDKFHVKGIFCSFNCALTHNYNSTDIESVIQEREALLRLMYKKNAQLTNSYDNEKLIYAPPKESLKKFGGSLTIEEFRKNGKVINVIYPPMISIIPQLEENELFEQKNNEIQQQKKNELDNMFGLLLPKQKPKTISLKNFLK